MLGMDPGGMFYKNVTLSLPSDSAYRRDAFDTSHIPCYSDVKIYFLYMFLSLRLSSVAEDTIRAYFESRLVLLEPVFPLACHRLCEGPDFSMEFGFKAQPQPEGKSFFFFF